MAQSNGSCGYIVVAGENIIHEYCEQHSDTTNNRMELTAIILAIEYANSVGNSAVIHSDSMYAVDIINVYMEEWRKNNWKKSSGGSVLNKDLILAIYFLINGDNSPKVVWVKAHNGDKYNEYVDNLINGG